MHILESTNYNMATELDYILLLVRVGLFFAFALNVLGDPFINLLFVIATTVCLVFV